MQKEHRGVAGPDQCGSSGSSSGTSSTPAPGRWSSTTGRRGAAHQRGWDLQVAPSDLYSDVPALAQLQRRAQLRRCLRPATMLALIRLATDMPTDDIPDID